jgi:branched-chain amino acid transport system ATP-binding protein
MQKASPDAGRPILEGRSLHTYYGQSHILRGVSIAIGAGETIGLMGRNGMGKTTLIRTLVGLIKPRSGQVLVDGADVTGRPAFQMARAGIAYVPEGRGIFASLSVAENLAIAERVGSEGRRTWTRERVLELFPRLSERLTNRGDQLSGGEQQMLAIGRALLTNPRLLILDEATEGLAPLVRDEIWKTVRLVCAAGIATVIVDKSVSAVTALADRIVVLVKGEIVFEGVPGDLLSDPELMRRHLGV